MLSSGTTYVRIFGAEIQSSQGPNRVVFGKRSRSCLLYLQPPTVPPVHRCDQV